VFDKERKDLGCNSTLYFKLNTVHIGLDPAFSQGTIGSDVRAWRSESKKGRWRFGVVRLSESHPNDHGTPHHEDLTDECLSPERLEKHQHV
jgi:hypothetical protein